MGTRLAGLYTVNGTETNSVEAMEQLRQWNKASDLGIDAQLSTDSIRIEVPGNHFVQCTLSFYGEADVTYYAEIRVNGLTLGLVSTQEVTVASKPFNMTVIGAGTVDIGDLVSVYIGSDEAGGANFRLLYGQFGVMSL